MWSIEPTKSVSVFVYKKVKDLCVKYCGIFSITKKWTVDLGGRIYYSRSHTCLSLRLAQIYYKINT